MEKIISSNENLESGEQLNFDFMKELDPEQLSDIAKDLENLPTNISPESQKKIEAKIIAIFGAVAIVLGFGTMVYSAKMPTAEEVHTATKALEAFIGTFTAVAGVASLFTAFQRYAENRRTI